MTNKLYLHLAVAIIASWTWLAFPASGNAQADLEERVAELEATAARCPRLGVSCFGLEDPTLTTGPQGPQGATGPRGPAGATGLTGPAGPSKVHELFEAAAVSMALEDPDLASDERFGI
jgi:hypothetical protein